jgi:DNA adenine methylase
MYISDANWQVVNAFREVARVPALVSEYLREQEELYRHEPRATFKRNASLMEEPLAPHHGRAGAFIVAQQSSFNGLWRVNSRGRYNVPFGKRKSINLPTHEELLAASDAMRFCIFENRPAYEQIRMGIGMAGPQFWYLDPPYLADANEHTRYTPSDFRADDHVKLVEQVNALAKHGNHAVMISSADSAKAREVYADLRGDWFVSKVTTQRSIAASGGARKTVVELVFTNYMIDDRVANYLPRPT